MVNTAVVYTLHSGPSHLIMGATVCNSDAKTSRLSPVIQVAEQKGRGRPTQSTWDFLFIWRCVVAQCAVWATSLSAATARRPR